MYQLEPHWNGVVWSRSLGNNFYITENQSDGSALRGGRKLYFSFFDINLLRIERLLQESKYISTHQSSKIRLKEVAENEK